RRRHRRRLRQLDDRKHHSQAVHQRPPRGQPGRRAARILPHLAEPARDHRPRHSPPPRRLRPPDRPRPRRVDHRPQPPASPVTPDGRRPATRPPTKRAAHLARSAGTAQHPTQAPWPHRAPGLPPAARHAITGALTAPPLYPAAHHKPTAERTPRLYLAAPRRTG